MMCQKLFDKMRCKEVSIAIKVILQIGLFVIFLFYFGIPAVEKYVKKDTIIIFGKVGWKSAFENKSVTVYNFRIANHCKGYEDIEGCIYIYIPNDFCTTKVLSYLFEATYW